MNKYYTVLFDNKELEYVLGQIKLKTSIEINFLDYPKISHFDPEGIVLFYNDGSNGNMRDITYSSIYDLFRYNGDSDSPYVLNNTYLYKQQFIDKIVEENRIEK